MFGITFGKSFAILGRICGICGSVRDVCCGGYDALVVVLMALAIIGGRYGAAAILSYI